MHDCLDRHAFRAGSLQTQCLECHHAAKPQLRTVAEHLPYTALETKLNQRPLAAPLPRRKTKPYTRSAGHIAYWLGDELS